MEHINLGKSANQIWKESGTSLAFKDWLQREKDKGVFLPNKKLMEFNDANGEGEEVDSRALIQETLKKANKKTIVSDNKNALLIGVGVLIVLVGGLAYYFTNKKE